MKTFALKMGLDLDQSVTLLETESVVVDSADTALAAVARRYQVSPQAICQMIQAAEIKTPDDAETANMPDAPPP